MLKFQFPVPPYAWSKIARATSGTGTSSSDRCNCCDHHASIIESDVGLHQPLAPGQPSCERCGTASVTPQALRFGSRTWRGAEEFRKENVTSFSCGKASLSPLSVRRTCAALINRWQMSVSVSTAASAFDSLRKLVRCGPASAD